MELETTVFNELQRRAKKEFLSVREMAEDILRRSAVMSKSRRRGGAPKVKVDKFVEYFSRYQPYNRRKKKKMKGGNK